MSRMIERAELLRRVEYGLKRIQVAPLVILSLDKEQQWETLVPVLREPWGTCGRGNEDRSCHIVCTRVKQSKRKN